MDQVKFLWVSSEYSVFLPLISAGAEDPEGAGDTTDLVELERMVVMEEPGISMPGITGTAGIEFIF